MLVIPVVLVFVLPVQDIKLFGQLVVQGLQTLLKPRAMIIVFLVRLGTERGDGLVDPFFQTFELFSVLLLMLLVFL